MYRVRLVYVTVVAVGVVGTAMAVWRPHWGGWATRTADLPFLAVSLATMVAVAVAATRVHGPARRVWLLLAFGMALNALGDVAFVVVTAYNPGLVVSPLDAVYLSSYLFIGAGLWLLARARGRGTAARAALDGMALAAGLGLLVWQGVIVAPGGLSEASSWIHGAVLVAYPVLDLLLLAGVATVLLSSVRREPSLWGLAAFVGMFLVSDLVFAAVSGSEDVLARWADVGFAVSFVALGLAALHDSAGHVTDEETTESAGLARFLVLGLALAAPGITAAVAVAITGGVNTAILVITTAFMVALVTVRVAVTIRSEIGARRAAESAQALLAAQMHLDGLTGLPNRAALMDRLAPMDTDRTPALLFVDLDRFKMVNDAAGHTTGDVVLRQAAARIRASVGPEDEVYRLAGDEFVVLCPSSADDSAAEATAAQVVAAFGPPFVVGALEWFLGASVGIAIGVPGDSAGADRLLRNADLAMYEAKRDGQRSVRRFDTGMRDRLQRRQDLEVSLRSAVEHGEIRPAFQAVVALGDRQIVGFEALARWRRQSGLEVPAREFIDVAESSGMIAGIDSFMLLRACHFIRTWNEQRPDRAPAWVSVNLSPKELAAGDPAARVARALADTGIDPGWLIIELTEGALAMDPDQAVRRLTAVHELGVGLAVDDFGTGYSSFAHLLRFPVDLLKVDQLFVASLTREGAERSVAAAAVGVARTLGIPAVAEGIETAEQADLLTELGYPLGQGFYFARPVSAAAAARLQLPARSTTGSTAPVTPSTLR